MNDEDWVTVLMYVGLAVWAAYRMWPRKPKRGLVPTSPDYKMYETAPAIADLWHNTEKISKCGDCKLADQPIVTSGFNIGFTFTPARCKYCAEFNNLTHHLKTATQGRWFKWCKRQGIT